MPRRVIRDPNCASTGTDTGYKALMPRKSGRVALRLLVGAVVMALVLLASPLRSHGWTHVPALTVVAMAAALAVRAQPIARR